MKGKKKARGKPATTAANLSAGFPRGPPITKGTPMLSEPGERVKSAHHSKMARKSWDNTPDRTARTRPGRIAAARAVLAALEAQTRTESA